MSLPRKIVSAIGLVLLAVAAYFGYGIIYTVRHIPEAYAAWDTGTLLVEYMEAHDGGWPSSWDDLLSVLNTQAGREPTLRGPGAGGTNYFRSLRTKVTVDWSFDPARNGQASPVSRPDGTRFPVVWEEPNRMIHAYLAARRRTNSTEVHEPTTR